MTNCFIRHVVNAQIRSIDKKESQNKRYENIKLELQSVKQIESMIKSLFANRHLEKSLRTR